MPSITQTFDPAVGPILEFGISRPASRNDSRPAVTRIIRGLVDTGANCVSVRRELAVAVGLEIIARDVSVGIHGEQAVDIFFGDLYLPVYVDEKLTHFPFRDRRLPELLNAPEGVDALIGQEVLNFATLYYNGPAKTFTLSW